MKSPIRGLGLILVTCLLPALAGCDGGSASAGGGATTAQTPAPTGTAQAQATPTAPVPVGTEAPVTPPPASRGGPVLSFERTFYDFGEVVDSERAETSFRFTNTGNSLLVISEVKASCGCTVPQLNRMQFAPGEGDVMQVTFDPKGKQGASTKNIRVTSNSVEEPVITLQLRSDVKPLLTVESRFIRLGDMTYGDELTREVVVSYNDPDLTFEEVSTNEPTITAHVIDSGTVVSTGSDITYQAKIGVTVGADAPWGSLFATRLFIKVNGRPLPDREPIDYTYELYLNGSRFGTLVGVSDQRGRTWNTSVVSLGSISPQQDFRTSLVIKSVTGQPFSLLEARIAESQLPGVQVEIVPQSPGAYEVVISGNTGNHRGMSRGTVELRTDVPGEELIEVHFTGSVR